MRILRAAFLVAALTSLALPALAAVKVYTGKNDLILNNGLNCPPTQTRRNNADVVARLTDNATGTVTLDELSLIQDTDLDSDQTTQFGPGAFIFVVAARTTAPAPGPVGVGSTANTTGSVAWGITTTWSATGSQICISSPTAFCGNVTTPHGATTPATVSSPTYDLGTWSFDAEGDMEGTPFIFTSQLGGVANSLLLLRGTFVGASLPALPLVGFGVLGLALAIAGGRSLRRK